MSGRDDKLPIILGGDFTTGSFTRGGSTVVEKFAEASFGSNAKMETEGSFNDTHVEATLIGTALTRIEGTHLDLYWHNGRGFTKRPFTRNAPQYAGIPVEAEITWTSDSCISGEYDVHEVDIIEIPMLIGNSIFMGVPRVDTAVEPVLYIGRGTFVEYLAELIKGGRVTAVGVGESSPHARAIYGGRAEYYGDAQMWAIIANLVYTKNIPSIGIGSYESFVVRDHTTEMEQFATGYLKGVNEKRIHTRGLWAAENIFEAIDTLYIHSAGLFTSEGHIHAKPTRDFIQEALWSNVSRWINAEPQELLSDLVDADSRRVGAQVEIYYDGKDNEPAVYTEHDLIDIYLEEELSASTEDILGAIAANELNVTIANEGGLYTPTNKDSPMHDKMVPGLLVKVSFKIYTSDHEHFFPVHMGWYYIAEWLHTSGSAETEIIAYDRAYTELNKEFPGLKIVYDTSYYNMFDYIFRSAGIDINEYNIHGDLLEMKVPIGWVPAGTMQEALSFLAEASNSFVYINRDDEYVVEQISTDKSRMGTFKDTTQIMSEELPTTYAEAYSQLDVTIHDTYLENDITLLQQQDLIIPPGTSKSEAYDMDEVGHVSYIKLMSETVELLNYAASATRIQLQFHNPTNKEQKIDFDVIGKAVESAQTTHQAKDEEIFKRIGEKTFLFNNPLIQTEEQAKTFAKQIFPIVFNPQSGVDMDVRGNPSIHAGALVRLVNETDKYADAYMLTKQVTFDWNGALNGTASGYIIKQEEEEEDV